MCWQQTKPVSDEVLNFVPWFPYLENPVTLTYFPETLGSFKCVLCHDMSPTSPVRTSGWVMGMKRECVYGEFGGWGWKSALMLEVLYFWLLVAMGPFSSRLKTPDHNLLHDKTSWQSLLKVKITTRGWRKEYYQKSRRKSSFGEHESSDGQVHSQLESMGKGGGTSLMWVRSKPGDGRRGRH